MHIKSIYKFKEKAPMIVVQVTYRVACDWIKRKLLKESLYRQYKLVFKLVLRSYYYYYYFKV